MTVEAKSLPIVRSITLFRSLEPSGTHRQLPRYDVRGVLVDVAYPPNTEARSDLKCLALVEHEGGTHVFSSNWISPTGAIIGSRSSETIALAASPSLVPLRLQIRWPDWKPGLYRLQLFVNGVLAALAPLHVHEVEPPTDTRRERSRATSVPA